MARPRDEHTPVEAGFSPEQKKRIVINFILEINLIIKLCQLLTLPEEVVRPDGEVEDVEGLSPVVPGSGWEEGELHEPTQSLGGNNQGRMTKVLLIFTVVIANRRR